jgi:hypothetical protein
MKPGLHIYLIIFHFFRAGGTAWIAQTLKKGGMSALRIIKAFSIMGISFFLVSGAGPKPEPSTDYKATTGRIEEYIDGVPGEEDFIDLIPQVSAESL